jgi:hypothetical protein
VQVRRKLRFVGEAERRGGRSENGRQRGKGSSCTKDTNQT